MQISLKNFRTKNLSLTTNSASFAKENEDNFELNLQVGIVQNTDQLESREAVVLFSIFLTSKDKFELSCDYEAIFSTDTLLNEQIIKEEKFLNINAPAIAYPYLRAFVSNVLLVANLDPAILPTINFQKLYDNNLKNRS